MHKYKFPDPRGQSEAELSHMRDLSDAFNQAVLDAFQKNRKLAAVEQSITQDEIGMMRVDPTLAQSVVPAEMATQEATDQFKKHDLPALEQLARNAINPKKP